MANKKVEMKPEPRYAKPIAVTPNHKEYHKLLKDDEKKIVCCTGWAGTGKSIAAAYYGCVALNKGKCDGIVIIRSLEGVGKNPGAYPGTDIEKNEPKLRQLMNYISNFTGSDIESLIRFDKLKICGLYDIQGIDLTNKYIIVTEAQTLSPEEMYVVVTRGGYKIVIEGDTLAKGQCTNKSIKFGNDGLSFLIETIGELDFVGRCYLDSTDDIVRESYIKDIIIRMTPKIL